MNLRHDLKVYHGTTESAVQSILKRGIVPRRLSKKSNWKHTVTSNIFLVYLTDCYAGYFAHCAQQRDEKWAIAEIDLAALDTDKLYPDEDFIAQALKQQGDYRGIDLNDLTTAVKNSLEKWKPLWEDSLLGLGCCAYKGTIPPEAITRIARYDPRSNPFVTLACLDPSITILNHLFCQKKYQALTRWLMGEKIALEDLFSVGEVSLLEKLRGYPREAILEKLSNQKINIITVRKEP
jgi:hypothetical protein